MHWLYDPKLSAESNALTQAEVQHAKSLRLTPGESVTLTNGRGLIARATMADSAVYSITETRDVPEDRIRFHLVQALAKSDRDEMALQASCELGLASVTPWESSRSIVRWSGKEQKNQLRWQQIALSAMKQSQQAWLCEVLPIAKTKQLKPIGLGLVLVPEANATLSSLDLEVSDITLVVGPEGGLANDEIEQLVTAGFLPVRLGASVLRTSTAGPAALSALKLATGLWG